MTLKEMKVKVLGLIEELNDNNENLTDDPDISNKINSVINQVQLELSRIKKIPAKMEYTVKDNKVMPMSSSMFQIFKIIGTSFQVIGKDIIFPDDFMGKVTIYYYKYPEAITKETSDDYEFELDDDVLEIMPYGVAGDLLKSDPSVDYSVYSNRYEQMLQRIDNRNSVGMVYIDNLKNVESIW